MAAWEAAWGPLADGCRPFAKRPGREDLAVDPVMGDDDMWISLQNIGGRNMRRDIGEVIMTMAA